MLGVIEFSRHSNYQFESKVNHKENGFHVGQTKILPVKSRFSGHLHPMSYERLLHLKRSNINQDEKRWRKSKRKERKKPSVLLERIRNPNQTLLRSLTLFLEIFIPSL